MLHERRAERTLRLELIVGAASHPKVLDRRLAASREGDDVIELERRSRRAALPRLVHECALMLVSPRDGPLHTTGDVPALGIGVLAAAWLVRCCELLFLELRHEHAKRPSEHRFEVRTRSRVTHEFFGALEKRLCVPADRELDRDSFGRKRCELGVRLGRRQRSRFGRLMRRGCLRGLRLIL